MSIFFLIKYFLHTINNNAILNKNKNTLNQSREAGKENNYGR